MRHASLDVAGVPQSAGDARRFLRASLEEWGCGDAALVEDAVLMVSELVTNVGLHARTTARLDIRLDPDHLRVEVHDESSSAPEMRPHSVGAEAGRGLRIVDALASRWGVEAWPGGKAVWFELPLGAAASR